MQAGPRHVSVAFAVLLTLPGLLTPLSPLQAQTASLAADIATGHEDDGIFLWGPILPVQDKLFFLASEPTTGTGLWVSDGTTYGTRVLPDLCDRCNPSDFELLGTLGGALLFNVKNLLTDHVLWRSDGTREGTFVLAETGQQELAESSVFFGGFLYFTNCEDATGCEIWRSDGTREGTGLWEDVEPGRGHSYSRFLTVAGGRLYFVTQDELRVLAPGARASTVVKSLPPFSASQLTAAGNRLFFLVKDEAEGTELWTSDGTSPGTRRVTDFAPDDPFPSTFLTPDGQRILFIANDGERGSELWESDGTPGGTRPLTDFSPTAGLGLPLVLGKRIVLFATDQGKSGPWAVTRSPRSLTFLPPCPGCGTWTGIQHMNKIGGRIVFQAEDEAHGIEPWTTDGTVAGTRLLKDICPGPCSSLFPDYVYVDPFRLFPQALVFYAHGNLWRSDGTTAGTSPLTASKFFIPADRLAVTMIGQRVVVWGAKDDLLWGLWETERPGQERLLAALPRDTSASSSPVGITALGDRAFFITCRFLEYGLWQTAGSPETTVLIGEKPDGFCPNPRFVAGGWLYLSGYDSLWRTDGTPGGIVQLAEDIELTPDFAELGGRVFFPARNGLEIWRTDGTAAGTVPVIYLRQDASGATDLATIGSQLYFMSRRPGGTALWRSDGTDAGTRKLADFGLDVDPSPDFTAFGSRVFFLTEDSVHGTDGTPEGTFLLKTRGSPSDLTVFQGALYFFADSSEGQELWRSDGAPQGTLRLRAFARGDIDYHNASRHHLTVLGGRLFFTADDGAHGVELWTSDGTEAGTALVRDIRPGAAPSAPRELVAAAGRLFFTANDGAHGIELWQSDGTAAGTRLVQDLAPEGLSSAPAELTVVGSHLYFSAYDPLTGRELWVLPLSGPACQPSSTRLCLNGGRFQVEAVWRDFTDRSGAGTAVPLTADTGYFWFFDSSNAEVALKVLDGRGFNDHFWVFYGGLSNVEYNLTVTDTQTGLTRRYLNPLRQLASVGDTHGFGPLGASSTAPDPLVASPSPPALVSARTEPAAATGTCAPGPRRLCLNGSRFAVEASWKDFKGNTGRGTAVSLSGDTGYFWFFDAANVEVMLKVLDGTARNGKFWVFYGALSNVEYTLTVTDTQTGAVKEYRNPKGRFASVADTGAF